MAGAFLIAAAVSVSIKVLAYVLSIVRFIHIGGKLASELRSGAQHALKNNAPALLNPIDRALQGITQGSAGWEKLLRLAFTAPVLISLASVIQLSLGSKTDGDLSLALGLAIATCSMLVLITAVLRRLILGAYDWETSDVKVPSRFLSEWAVAKEHGANNSLYFLILIYLSVLGFAALYFGLGVSHPASFAHEGSATSPVTWLYFSITTLATVGYGDIHPVSEAGKAAVICQISTGPLLLSWLLSVLLTTRRNAVSPADL